ncbi:MAG: DUF4149 domain-containing protein [Labilithrix sp.]|nr:DUF4149 domain-containing protein [Labilithrix sp.]
MHANRRLAFIAVVQILAIGLWAGGLVALGAVAAPIVFRVVPAPTSADAMTLVFQRFDRVAITCAAVALAAEVAFITRGGKVTRLDVARASLLTIAGLLAIAIGAWLSPGIAELHHAGAVRGLGDGGLALERLHRLAETFAKAQLFMLVVVTALSIAKVGRGTSVAEKA